MLCSPVESIAVSCQTAHPNPTSSDAKTIGGAKSGAKFGATQKPLGIKKSSHR